MYIPLNTDLLYMFFKLPFIGLIIFHNYIMLVERFEYVTFLSLQLSYFSPNLLNHLIISYITCTPCWIFLDICSNTPDIKYFVDWTLFSLSPLQSYPCIIQLLIN